MSIMTNKNKQPPINKALTPKDLSSAADRLKTKTWHLIKTGPAYTLFQIKPLGEGSFASVHKSYHVGSQKNPTLSDKIFSAKISKPQQNLSDKKFNRLWKSEAELLAQYQPVNAFTKLNGRYVLISDYLGKKNMAQAIKDGDIADLTFKDRVDLVTQLLTQLKEMHSNNPNSLPIIHRDIKPENIMFSRSKSASNKTVINATLIDFGLATTISSHQNNGYNPANTNVIYKKSYAGTPHYFAPETVECQTSFSSDIYSLLSILLWLFGATAPLENKKKYSAIRKKIVGLFTKNKFLILQSKEPYSFNGLFGRVERPQCLYFVLPLMQQLFFNMQSIKPEKRPKTNELWLFFFNLSLIASTIDNDELESNSKMILFKKQKKSLINSYNTCISRIKNSAPMKVVRIPTQLSTSNSKKQAAIKNAAHLKNNKNNPQFPSDRIQAKIRRFAYYQLLNNKNIGKERKKDLTDIATENLIFEALVILYSLRKKTPAVLKNKIFLKLINLSTNNAYLKKFDTHHNILLNKLTQRQYSFRNSTLKENIAHLGRRFKHEIKCLISPGYRALTKEVNRLILRHKTSPQKINKCDSLKGSSRKIADKLTVTPTLTNVFQPKTNSKQQTSSVHSHISSCASSFTYSSASDEGTAKTSQHSSISTQP
jgi:serine/threonine protein kinase